MESIRSRRKDIIDDPLHKMNFLDWIKEQTERIERFSNIIVVLENDQSAVSMAKITECLAKYTSFFTIQTSFYQIYKKAHEDKKEEMDSLFDKIYMDVKGWTIDPETDMGKRYLKKAATQEEIRKEAISHSDWNKYMSLSKEVQELELKTRAQKRYLDIINKYDIILQVLKKRDEKEIKFLYLEQ